MLNRVVDQGLGHKLSNLTGLFAAFVIIFAVFALPAHAQEVETFDPDDAFGASISQETEASQTETSPNASQTDPDFGAFGTSPATSASPQLTEPEMDVVEPMPRQPNYRIAPSLDPVTGRTLPEDDAAVAEGDVTEYENGYSTYDGAPAEPPVQSAAPQDSTTYGQDDLIGAAEGIFGKGAQGLAKMIENLLRDQGEPNGYIVGREAGGAFIVGARYGSGTLHHKVEGERKVYWTGPSVGFDAGANASNTFVLVYNLYDTEDIFRRYPAGEGQAYLIGGLHASYVRRGDIVLIPIRMGAGLRLGVNAGYMRFSKKQRWLPF